MIGSTIASDVTLNLKILREYIALHVALLIISDYDCTHIISLICVFGHRNVRSWLGLQECFFKYTYVVIC